MSNKISKDDFVKYIKTKAITFPYKKDHVKDIALTRKKLFQNLKSFALSDTNKRVVKIDQYEISRLPKISKNNVMFGTDAYNLAPIAILNEESDYDNYNITSDYFIEEQRMKCRIDGYDSIHNLFYNDPEKLADMIMNTSNENTIDVGFDTKVNYLRESIYNIKPTIECTTHRPTNLISLINYLFPTETKNKLWVYDSSSGWGDRLLGALAAGVNYIATDPNTELHPYYDEMIATAYKHYSELINSTNEYKIFNVGSETNQMYDNLLKGKYMFDLMYTSPPYFKYETYSDASTQSTSKYDTEEDWYVNFLLPTLRTGWAFIKEGGYMAININQSSNDQTFVYRMIEDVSSLFDDIEYCGVISYADKNKYTNYKNGNAKYPPNFQPIWIWRKKACVQNKNIIDILANHKDFPLLVYNYFKSMDNSVTIENINYCISNETDIKKGELLYEILINNKFIGYINSDISLEYKMLCMEMYNTFSNKELEEAAQQEIYQYCFNMMDEGNIKYFSLISSMFKDKSRLLYIFYNALALNNNINNIFSHYQSYISNDGENAENITAFNETVLIEQLNVISSLFSNDTLIIKDEGYDNTVNNLNIYTLFRNVLHYFSIKTSSFNIQPPATLEKYIKKTLFSSVGINNIRKVILLSIYFSKYGSLITNDEYQSLFKTSTNIQIKNKFNRTVFNNIKSQFEKYLYAYKACHNDSPIKHINEITELDIAKNSYEIIKSKYVNYTNPLPKILLSSNIYDMINTIDVHEEWYKLPRVWKTYDEIPGSMNYVSGKSFISLRHHNGQRKLLMCEIQFLTEKQLSPYERNIVIYAGAAPSHSKAFLAKLFPAVHFIFIDPNTFDITLKYEQKKNNKEMIGHTSMKLIKNSGGKYEGNDIFPDLKIAYVKSKNNLSEEKARKWVNPATNNYVSSEFSDLNSSNPPAYLDYNNDKVVESMFKFITQHNITIIEDFYTEHTSKFFNYMFGRYNMVKQTAANKQEVINYKVFFWSDIRTADEENPKDIDIVFNSALQLSFIYHLKPDSVMLKFRAPFRNDVEEFKIKHTSSEYMNLFNKVKTYKHPYNIDFVKDFIENESFKYFDGSINLQTRTGIISSETRLVFDLIDVDGKPKDPTMRIYNSREYEDKFMFNNMVRSFMPFYNPLSNYRIQLSNNERFNNWEHGIDNCFDCAIEYEILYSYFRKYTTISVPSNQESLITVYKKFMRDIHVDIAKFIASIAGYIKSIKKDGHGNILLMKYKEILNDNPEFSNAETILTNYIKTAEYYQNKQNEFESKPFIRSKGKIIEENEFAPYSYNDNIINENLIPFKIFISDKLDSYQRHVSILQNYISVNNIVKLVNAWENADMIIKPTYEGIEKLHMYRNIYVKPSTDKQFVTYVTKSRDYEEMGITDLNRIIKNILQNVIKSNDNYASLNSDINELIEEMTDNDSTDTEIYDAMRKMVDTKGRLNNKENEDRRENLRKNDIEELISMPNIIPPNIESYLDIGCNEGGITKIIGETIKAKNINGTDIFEPKDKEGFKFILSDESGTYSMYKDKSQNVISAFMVLHHIFNLKIALTNIHRMLTDDGVFIIREHNCIGGEIALLLDIMHGVYSQVAGEEKEDETFTNHYAYYRSMHDMIDLIESFGFKLVTRTKPIGYIRSYYAVFKKINYFNGNPYQCIIVDNKNSTQIDSLKEIYVNTFPKHELVTNKKNMLLTYRRWCQTYGINIDTIIPKTWLPEEITKIRSPTNKLFIIKPEGGFGGQNITIIKDINKLSSKNIDNNIIQEYIEDVATLKHISKDYQCKFDIRVNLIFTKMGEVWIYDNILLRVSDKEYTLNDLNNEIHITNLDIRNYDKNNSIRYITGGTKDPYLKSLKANIQLFMMKYIIPVISETVVKDYYDYNTGESFYYNLNCYQRFGIDLIAMKNGNIKLLEINTNPGLPDDTDNLIKANLWFGADNNFVIPDDNKLFTDINRPRKVEPLNVNVIQPIYNSTKKIYISPTYFDSNYIMLLYYKYKDTLFKNIEIVNKWDGADLVIKYKFNEKDFASYQRCTISKYPNIESYSRKDELFKNMYNFFQGEIPFLPDTYITNNENYDNVISQLEDQLYIVKPIDSYGGMGIKIGTKKDLLSSEFKDVRTRNNVIQQYINPSLIDGHKYDIRVLYVIDNNGKINLYKNYMIRTAPNKYNTDVLDTNTHITNAHGKDANWASLIRWSHIHPVLDNEAVYNKIFEFSTNIIKPFINEYVIAPSEEIKNKYDIRMYQFIGIDIMFDENNKLYLLEMNAAPGTSATFTHLNFCMMSDVNINNEYYIDIMKDFTEL